MYRRFVVWGLVGSTAFVSSGLVAACNADSSFSALSDDGGGDETSTDEPDAGDVDGADGNGGAVDARARDAVSDVQPDTTPPVPPVQCTEVPDAQHGAFVSASASTPSTTCDPTTPCKTIADAIAWAKNNGRNIIYVDQGTYIEHLDLVAGFTVQGGWKFVPGTGWKRICDETQRANAVVVKAPPGVEHAALAENLASESILDTMQIRNENDAAPGESRYGLVVRGAGTVVTLKGVGVYASAGGVGAPGSTGAAGAVGSGCTSAGDGSTPPAGAAWSGPTEGTFDATGYHPATAGTGAIGAAGANGAAGGAGTCLSTCQSDADCGGTVVPQCLPASSSSVCGGSGQPGCGGGPGSGGTGGGGGGSSIGVYVWGGKVNADLGLFTSSAGGNGGAAGAGGGGGAGSQGTTGAAGTCYQSCKAQSGSFCVPANPKPVSGGAPGGPGGQGSAGGAGGSGAGGHSYAYYTGGGGSVAAAGTGFQYGSAGNPGQAAPGGNMGAPGIAADHN